MAVTVESAFTASGGGRLAGLAVGQGGFTGRVSGSPQWVGRLWPVCIGNRGNVSRLCPDRRQKVIQRVTIRP